MINRKRIPSIGWILFIFLVKVALAVEHDSLLCEEKGSCPEPSHTVIRLEKRDDELARRIAEEHDMVVKGQPFLDSHYFLEHKEQVSKRRKRSTIVSLNEHPDVEWVSEQRPRPRTKRDYIHNDDEDPESFASQVIRKKREQTTGVNPENGLPIPKLPFPDPLYDSQWYLVGKAVGGFDMNVRSAWALGYAGRNVSISILDDGIQRDHPDLVQNYDPIASTDINDHDDDPTPQNNGDNKHGTRCAGEVAAVAGNNVCGVGVAYHAKIGGVRMLDGPVSDSVEAASLNLNQDHIDIYSASWGPEDDGKTFDGPGPLAREAFYRGIKKGRGGKGNIFVWASGNGGSRQDSCSADGYTTSVYTLSISSATYDNHRPWYLEECPSTIASTYSSANANQPAIVTVDVPNGCTKMHTGTSASAPLAAGIIALALEANPGLTWRDMQHIVLRTANPNPLMNNPGWSVNGVGRRISNKFGYGLMDAGALVKLAKVWNTVPEQHMCTYEYKLSPPNPRPLAGRFQLNFTLDVNGCRDGTPILYLEHVQVLTTIRFAKRGDLKLTLFSPMGTKSVLLPPRPQDFNQNGFHKWPFLSVQSWGEDPRGTWTLMVESVASNPKITGSFSDWTLLLYGTQQPAQPSDPKHTREPVFQTGSQMSSSGVVTQPSETPYAPISFGDLSSVGDCHAECLGGCSEKNSATGCFACKHYTQSLRNRAGFRCVDSCDEGYFLDGDKCKVCSNKCKTCKNAEQCDSCHGAQLLIDIDHFGHFDHGQCVDSCPLGLISDYDTNLIQARCVLKKNPCSRGYYQDERSNCVACDPACAICHGPGALKCDECTIGYANNTYGFCRPCCGKTPENEHCEECSVVPSKKTYSESSGDHPGFLKTLLFAFFTVGIFVLAILYCMKCFDDSSNRSNNSLIPFLGASNEKEYTQLQNSADIDVENLSDDLDSEEEELFGIGKAKTSMST